MRVRWFGVPWPSAENRAPVCESDDDRVDMELVIGRDCIECEHEITERDHGVITSCSPTIWHHWKLVLDGTEHPVCAYHLHCFLRNTLGPTEFGPKILQRMRQRPLRNDRSLPLLVTPDEEVKPGRGWRKAEPVVGDDEDEDSG